LGNTAGRHFITGPAGLVVQQLELNSVPLYLHSPQVGKGPGQTGPVISGNHR
jgi:hypothetical protein